jgi:hypothetical protein
MAETAGLRADVFVDAQLTPECQDVIVDTLAALGASAHVKAVPSRRGASELPWIILAALPLQSFLAGLGTKVADDTYQALQDAVRRLLRGKPAGQATVTRPLVLQDASTGLQIILEHDLPPEGYRQLMNLDLSRYRRGPLRYDRTQRRWRSELDEATVG